MKVFTFSALMSIIFFSGIAIVLLKAVFRNNNAILRLDIRFLLSCMLLILLRLLIPIESPLTNNIPVYRLYPSIYMFLKEPVYEFSDTLKISIMMVLKLIWAVGAAFCVIRLIYSYWLVRREIAGFSKAEDPVAEKLIEEINKEYGRHMTFELKTGENVYTPFVFGIIKPMIVIPQMGFEEKELYFVLKHEMLHFYRGDMLIKLGCEALKAIYWWNPFAYILGRLVANMQEINVDFNIIRKLPELEQLDYSACLVKVAKRREKQKTESKWVMAFQKESPSAVHKRITLMLQNLEISGGKTAVTILLSVFILCLILLCPNMLIFEPYSISNEVAEGSVGGRDGGIYYIDNQDGTYSLYVDGEYYSNVTEIFDENIKVYDSIEDVENSN